MKTILVPTDFSPASRKAGEYAAALALAIGADIQLLHVYRELMPATVGPEPWSVTESNLHKENEVKMNEEISFFRQYYSIEVGGDVRLGFKGDSISAAARECGAGLIVMGMKKSRPGKILGSTTMKMIRKTDVPVLVIPEGVIFQQLNNIVLAVDFNEMTDSATFDPLYELVKKFDANLRVIHIEAKGAPAKASELPEKLQLGRALYRFTYQYDRLENEHISEGIKSYLDNHGGINTKIFFKPFIAGVH